MNPLEEPIYEALFQKTVGVVEDSDHQAYFEQSLVNGSSRPYPTRQLAFNALKTGEVDAVFTDALSASFWLASASCGGLLHVFSEDRIFLKSFLGTAWQLQRPRMIRNSLPVLTML